jgi:hypothetical protein
MHRDAPYRRSAHRCELCNRDAGAAGLVRYAALGLCEACIGGDLHLALGRWGLTLDPDGLRWIGRIEIELRFTRERFGHRLRKVLGLGDPEVGDETFDHEVWVTGLIGVQAKLLLAEEGARQAISIALQTAEEVGLFPDRVVASTDERLPLVALAVHVTRLIRRLRAKSFRAPRARDRRVPLGRKVCRSCNEVSFDRVARCPSCKAEAWWR